MEVVLVHILRNVHLLGVVEMGPQGFLEDGDYPHAQEVRLLAVDPARRLYHWLAAGTVPLNV